MKRKSSLLPAGVVLVSIAAAVAFKLATREAVTPTPPPEPSMTATHTEVDPPQSSPSPLLLPPLADTVGWKKYLDGRGYPELPGPIDQVIPKTEVGTLIRAWLRTDLADPDPWDDHNQAFQTDLTEKLALQAKQSFETLQQSLAALPDQYGNARFLLINIASKLVFAEGVDPTLMGSIAQQEIRRPFDSKHLGELSPNFAPPVAYRHLYKIKDAEEGMEILLLLVKSQSDPKLRDPILHRPQRLRRSLET